LWTLGIVVFSAAAAASGKVQKDEAVVARTKPPLCSILCCAEASGIHGDEIGLGNLMRIRVRKVLFCL
jgi:hypothetical protein